MLEKIEKKVKIYIGRQLADQFKNFKKFRNSLLNFPVNGDEKPTYPQRYIDLTDYFYKIYLSAEEGAEKFSIRLELIVDWDHFVESFKRSFEGAFFYTKKNVDLFFMVGLISWICKPTFLFRGDENFYISPAEFDPPQDSVDQIQEYVKAIKLASFEEEALYRKLKYCGKTVKKDH